MILLNKFKKLYKKFVSPILLFRPYNIPRYFSYISEYNCYRKLTKSKIGLWPILGENTYTTTIDPHYFYQTLWSLKMILNEHPTEHVDVGSQAIFVGVMSISIKTKFIDIRPLDVKLDNFENIRGSILNLPLKDSSVSSLSCLHVAEHIGLGRYGDPLDADGTIKACHELARVLAPGGRLYFSVPIGKEITLFNAHRIFKPSTIIEYFKNLKLVSFSAINDKGELIEKANINAFNNARYSCGLFEFSKTG